MFTGIIRETGIITRIKRGNPWLFTIKAPELAPSIQRGDSISVSGACLTAVSISSDSFDVEVSTETINRTIFSAARSGMYVNLEPAITMSAALDGHIVQGHVDGTGRITRLTGGKQKEIHIKPDTDAGSLIVEKGSVTVDGISLTIAKILPGSAFSIAVIPLTVSDTTLKYRHAGDRINLEYDIIGKYVNRWLSAR